MSEEKIKKQNDKKKHYLSQKESRDIARENKRMLRELEKKKHRHLDESEYTVQMKEAQNIVEFDNLHTYFFTDAGDRKSVV